MLMVTFYTPETWGLNGLKRMVELASLINGRTHPVVCINMPALPPLTNNFSCVESALLQKLMAYNENNFSDLRYDKERGAQI